MLDLRELQCELTKVLVAFDRFCRAHDLSYSLSSGTLLGAIREKGFIPWDEDADLSMPRPDYDKLCAMADVFKAETGLLIAGHLDLSFEIAPFLKICDPRIRVHLDGAVHDEYAWVDVFPADGLPEDDEELAEHYRKANIWQNALMLHSVTVDKTKDEKKRLVRYLLYPFSRTKAYKIYFGKRLTKLGRSVPYGSTAYVGHLTWGLSGPRERVPLKGYAKSVNVSFEGHEFKAMSCWDEYLTGLYYDYMTPHPEGSRPSHHIVAWYADNEEVSA